MRTMQLKKEKKFSEVRAKFYAAQILLALECLHQHNIVYRDLKVTLITTITVPLTITTCE